MALRKVLLDSIYMPHARLAEGLALSSSGAVSASIDSSDGLAWCLHELSVQSRVGFEVSDLPLAAEAEEFAHLNGLDTTDLAVYGGEEYELVLTVKPDCGEKLQRLWKPSEANLSLSAKPLLISMSCLTRVAKSGKSRPVVTSILETSLAFLHVKQIVDYGYA